MMSSPPRPALRQIAIEATVIDEGALKRAQEDWRQQVQLEEERREEQRRRAAMKNNVLRNEQSRNGCSV